MNIYSQLSIPLLITLSLAFSKFFVQEKAKEWEGFLAYLPKVNTILIILGLTWCLLVLTRILKENLLKQFDILKEDNLKARKIYTTNFGFCQELPDSLGFACTCAGKKDRFHPEKLSGSVAKI